ncbi:MAG: hypothetical protein J3Q66DRAFT_374820 [Benniella sp.]|nr:MAG: hypothetical protein J3Q66DRAFT_374820 [Benniella sp.]
MGIGRSIEQIVTIQPGFNSLPAMLEFLLSSLGNSTLPDAEKERLSVLVKDLSTLSKDIAPESIRDILSAIDKNPLLDPARKTLLAPFADAFDPDRDIKYLRSLISQETRKLYKLLKLDDPTEYLDDLVDLVPKHLETLKSRYQKEYLDALKLYTNVSYLSNLSILTIISNYSDFSRIAYPSNLSDPSKSLASPEPVVSTGPLDFLEPLGLPKLPKLPKGFQKIMLFYALHGITLDLLLRDGGLFYPPDKVPYTIFKGTNEKDTYTMTVTDDAKISIKNSKDVEMWTYFLDGGCGSDNTKMSC